VASDLAVVMVVMVVMVECLGAVVMGPRASETAISASCRQNHLDAYVTLHFLRLAKAVPKYANITFLNHALNFLNKYAVFCNVSSLKLL
jgi:hypothetical protein